MYFWTAILQNILTGPSNTITYTLGFLEYLKISFFNGMDFGIP